MINEELCNNINNEIGYDSPILLTQYSSEASQLIKSFTKKIPFVVVILTANCSYDNF